MRKRGLALDKLESLIALLQAEEVLPQSYRDHALVGVFENVKSN
ncbi:type II toxin-antitoxin system YafQ family toxin, partial [Streptococcus sobrinus]